MSISRMLGVAALTAGCATSPAIKPSVDKDEQLARQYVQTFRTALDGYTQNTKCDDVRKALAGVVGGLNGEKTDLFADGCDKGCEPTVKPDGTKECLPIAFVPCMEEYVLPDGTKVSVFVGDILRTVDGTLKQSDPEDPNKSLVMVSVHSAPDHGIGFDGECEK